LFTQPAQRFVSLLSLLLFLVELDRQFFTSATFDVRLSFQRLSVVLLRLLLRLEGACRGPFVFDGPDWAPAA